MSIDLSRTAIARDVPANAHILPVQVRSYEVTRSGRITPAVVLRYLEYLATQASAARGFDHVWYEQNGSAWVVRDMVLRLGSLPSIDDELRMATWLSEFRRVQAFREYAVWNVRTGSLVARARARWAYIDRVRGVPIRIHDELLAGFGILGSPMREHPLAPQFAAEGAEIVHELTLTAREYEADTQQHVNNCVYVDWLMEATQRALNEHPGTLGQAALWRPRHYQIEYARPTLPGDRVIVATHMKQPTSRRMDVWQVVRIQGAGTENLSVRSYSQHLLCKR